MTYKFEIIGQSLIISNADNDETLFDLPKSKVYYRLQELERDGIVYIYDIVRDTISNNNKAKIFQLTDCVDKDSISFTETTFKAFARTSLGFSGDPSKLDSIVSNTGGDGTNSKSITKFGEILDLDGSEEIIASFSGAYNPLVDVMTVAQTFTITYDETTDGSSGEGVRGLQVVYLDENFNEQTGFHFLGNTGSDVTSFTGLGINRLAAISYGANAVAGNNITFTATSDATTQAQMPIGRSTTLQCLYHIPIGKTLDITKLHFNVIKASGQGSSPVVNIQLYSFSRITRGIYSLIDVNMDTSIRNNLPLEIPTTFTGREVIYLTASTDQLNTKIFARFTGTERDS